MVIGGSLDWDVLIAHFLGVDHVGHRFGPRSRAMEVGVMIDSSMLIVNDSYYFRIVYRY